MPDGFFKRLVFHVRLFIQKSLQHFKGRIGHRAHVTGQRSFGPHRTSENDRNLCFDLM